MKDEEIKERLIGLQEQIDGLSDYTSAELKRLNDLFIEKVGRRDNNDLDSIEHGTPKHGVIKIYFNAKEDSIEEVRRRFRLALDVLIDVKNARGEIK